MNPGKLNKRITIYKDAENDKPDDYGEPLDAKVILHECWASVKNKRGSEQFKADTPFSKEITSFLIRYTKKKIDTTMKIDFNGGIYNIIYIDNYNFSNQWIEITAEKVN